MNNHLISKHKTMRQIYQTRRLLAIALNNNDIDRAHRVQGVLLCLYSDLLAISESDFSVPTTRGISMRAMRLVLWTVYIYFMVSVLVLLSISIGAGA